MHHSITASRFCKFSSDWINDITFTFCDSDSASSFCSLSRSSSFAAFDPSGSNYTSSPSPTLHRPQQQIRQRGTVPLPLVQLLPDLE